MKSKLIALYKLQTVDSELDEIREIRGDLPTDVDDMEQQLLAAQKKVSDCDVLLAEGTLERVRKEKESLELIAKIDVYKSQQLSVHNNKEYDALTHEIEMAEKTIEAYEEEVESHVVRAEDIRKQKAVLNLEIETLSAELEAKRHELNEVMETTVAEETSLFARRDAILKEVEQAHFIAYKRIRDAKNGRAIVPINRRSCSGCYNIVPPQLHLEIKKNDRLIECEHCGRILVSELVVEEAKKH